MQVRKCFKCNEYEPNKLAQKHCPENHTIIDTRNTYQYCSDHRTVFISDECKYSVDKHDSVVEQGLKPNGSRCMTDKKPGLCILGNCFAIGVTNLNNNEANCPN